MTQTKITNGYLGKLDPKASLAVKLKRRLHDLVAMGWLDKAAIAWRERRLSDLAAQPKTTVVQVGASDGEYHDPLTRMLMEHDIKALLVEPQQGSFVELERKYEDKALVKCVRQAVSAKSGQLVLYKAVMANGDKFGIANATSNPQQLRQVLKWHPIRRLRGYRIIKETVPTLPLTKLLQDAEIEAKEITVFCCDTEGADILVMDQFFTTGARPQLVQYEHLHSPPSEVLRINQQLAEAGYHLRFTYTDVIASR